MTAVLIVLAAILAAAAAAEAVILFLIPLREVSPLYAAVLPVFAEDELFPRRLDRLALSSCGRSYLIIIDCSATPAQLELCRQFCSDNPDCIIIKHDELEKTLAKMFAIHKKM